MNFIVVYNSRSGKSLPRQILKKAFTDAGHTVEHMIEINSGLDELAKYNGRHGTVIAGYGGDGTMASIANKLAGTNMLFAPLPGGTLNHFTKDIGIAQNVKEAIGALASSKPRLIDIATVNDRVFLNNSSIGLYPSSLQMRDEMQRKRTSKWVAAIIASFKAFVRYRSYTVEINGERFRTPFVFVGNNDYELENRLIGNRKRLDGGILSVYSVVASDRFHLLLIFIKALFGKIKAIDEIKLWKTDHLIIQTPYRSIRVSRDGEHERVNTPLIYKIKPKSLYVIGSL